MPKLTITGWGSNVIFYRISRHTADILAFRGILEEKFDELFGIGGSETPIFDETAITDDELSFYVDDSLILTRTIDTKGDLSEYVAEINGCYLVIDYSYTGTWLSLNINEKFDENKLEISCSKYLLPTGSEVSFKHVYYDEESNFGTMSGEDVDITVVYPDKKCYGIEFRDDYDEDN